MGILHFRAWRLLVGEDLQQQHSFFHHEAYPEAFPDSMVGHLGAHSDEEVKDMAVVVRAYLFSTSSLVIHWDHPLFPYHFRPFQAPYLTLTGKGHFQVLVVLNACVEMHSSILGIGT